MTGAESGLLMSYAHSDQEELEITRFTITVKFLFWSTSHDEITVHTDIIESSSLTFTSFNTLDPASSRINAGPGPGGIGIASQSLPPDETRTRVQDITLGTQDLSAQISERRPLLFRTQMGMQNWKDGGTFSVAHSASRLMSMYASGILLQIQLVPYAILREYQEVLGSKA